MQARTAIVYVDLPTTQNDTPLVRAGMFATGEFELGNTRVLTLPQESVVMRDGFSYVFKVRDAARVSQVRRTRVCERVLKNAFLAWTISDTPDTTFRKN
jgi:hypothetical protein